MPHEQAVSTVRGVALPLKDARIQFAYVNWRGVRHHYVIDVESVELGPYEKNGFHMETDEVQWVLHGRIVRRDGDPRNDLGDHPSHRRRTFIMKGMENIEVVI